MSCWQHVRLGDLGEVNRGRSRHRPRDAAHLYGGPYPFIQTGDIKASNGRITTHFQTYSEDGLAQSRLWPANTMVITIAANIAETAILTYPACFPDSVVGFIADPKKANVRFVEYLFRLHRRQIQHENVGTGSVQDNINLQTISRIDLLVPSVREQQAIASVLAALDDKIELNRRMNATLEAMARAIFKDWFVNFGPTRAKMEGRPPYLAPDIWALFPDRLDDDDKPEGWGFGTLSDYALLNSESWTRADYPDRIEYVDLSGTKWGTIENTELLERKSAPSRAQRRLREGDTIVGTVRPGNGSYAFVSRQGLTGSTGFAMLRPREPKFQEFIYLAATAPENIDRLSHLADGAAYPAVRPEIALATEAVLADGIIVQAFGDIARPLVWLAEANKRESYTLAATRDLLLPKLMSGEIRVKDAEKIAEAAA